MQINGHVLICSSRRFKNNYLHSWSIHKQSDCRLISQLYFITALTHIEEEIGVIVNSSGQLCGLFETSKHWWQLHCSHFIADSQVSLGFCLSGYRVYNRVYNSGWSFVLNLQFGQTFTCRTSLKSGGGSRCLFLACNFWRGVLSRAKRRVTEVQIGVKGK